MKNKLITKVVLILAGLALTLSAFTACVDDKDFANVESNVAELESTLTQDQAQLKTVETELRALVDSVKATADAAVTQTKLDAAIATLKSGDTDSIKAVSEALATVKSALEASLAANTTADAETKATIEAAIAAVKATADAAATASDLSSLKTTVAAVEAAYAAADEAIKAQVTELNGKLATLKTTVDGLTTDLGETDGTLATLGTTVATIQGLVDALTSDVANLNTVLGGKIESVEGELETLKDAVDAMGGNAALEIKDFVDGYNLATKVLSGTATVEDFGGNEALYDQYVVYSLAHFYFMAGEVDSQSDWYYTVLDSGLTEYEAFVLEKDTVEFFLTRATSIETIEALFTGFGDYIKNMSTLVELLEAAIENIENNQLVTDDAACYASVTAIMAKIDDVNNDANLANDVDVPTGLTVRFNTIQLAQENLANAKAQAAAVISAINALPAPQLLLYNNGENVEFTAADSAFTVLEGYFANENYVALYVEDMNAAEKLLGTKYDVLKAAQERYEELTNAAQNKPVLNDEISDMIYFFDDEWEKPVYTQFALIEEAKNLIDAWATEYNLEDMHIRDICGEFFNVTDAYSFVSYLCELYENVFLEDAEKAPYSVTELKADIDKLFADLEAGDCSYADYELSIKCREGYDMLFDSVWGAVFSDDDTNFDLMFGDEEISAEDRLAHLEAVEERMAVLNDLNEEIKAVKVEMTAMLGNVGYQDYPTIDGFKTTIEGIFVNYEIDEDNVNYAWIGDPAFELQAKLVAEYKEKTARVALVYEALMSATDSDANITLADGNKLWDAYAAALTLSLELGVGNTDIDLTVLVDGDEEEVNLKDILDAWYVVAADFEAMCIEAETEAAAINAAIAALTDLNTADLNNYAAIKAALGMYTAWAENYLGAADADLSAVQAIKKFNSEATYAFVTVANYELLTAKNDEIDATKALAETAFADVKALFDAVTEWDLHSTDALTLTEDAYTAYVAEYYNNAVVDGIGVLNEETIYNDVYGVLRDAFIEKHENAIADREAIAEMMAALPTLEALYNGTADAAEAVEATDAIYDAIAAYIATYGCDINVCTNAFDAFSAEDQLKLNKVAEYAKFVVAYNADAFVDDPAFQGLYSTVYNAMLNATALVGDNSVANVVEYAFAELARLLAGVELT